MSSTTATMSSTATRQCASASDITAAVTAALKAQMKAQKEGAAALAAQVHTAAQAEVDTLSEVAVPAAGSLGASCDLHSDCDGYVMMKAGAPACCGELGARTCQRQATGLIGEGICPEMAL